MGRPANAALVAHGVTTLEQVATMTERELLAVHGVGPKAVAILRDELAARGLRLADRSTTADGEANGEPRRRGPGRGR